MHFTNDGLSLWYGTSDAPAPGDDGVAPRRGARLVVGVSPPSPSNTLNVRYRVDAGQEQSAPGRELRVDYGRKMQYFLVVFPDFESGSVVEYLPVLSCAGRQVPAVNASTSACSKFTLAHAAQSSAVSRLKTADDLRHFTAGLEFVANVSITLDPLQYLTDTAAGVRVDFFVQDGTLVGKGFQGKVLARSCDHLLVRRDGMGDVDIKAAFATHDGARLDVVAGGYVDLGADGYRRALAQDLPDRAPFVLTPLVYTRHPRYRWLSRVQCVAVGYTNLHARRLEYSVYATSSHRTK